MISSKSRRLLVAVTCLMTINLLAASAHAAGAWSVSDDRRDAKSGIDIKRTTLDTHLRGFIRVRIFGFEFVKKRINTANAYFDTVRENAGPEFLIEWGLPDDGVWDDPDDPIYDGNDRHAKLLSVDTWTPTEAEVVPCKRIRLAINYETDIITIAIPKRCLGNPSELRWNAETRKVTETHADGSYRYYYDGAPEHFRLGPWVL